MTQDGLTELASGAKTNGWDALHLFEEALKELKEKHLRKEFWRQKLFYAGLAVSITTLTLSTR